MDNHSSDHLPNQPLQVVPLDSFWPSPENDEVYRPVNTADPAIRRMAKSIRKEGQLLEPIVVTLDDFILSGHRRYAAAKLAGLTTVEIRRYPIRRTDDIDEFIRLLAEFNQQREKTNSERLREEIVCINPEDAHARLLKHRRDVAATSVASLKPGKGRARSKISKAKRPMLEAAIAVIHSRKKFWPLSDRQIHYALLNNPPLRHTRKPDSIYRNDKDSYKDLTNLLTRARVAGLIEYEAIGDETRPVSIWDVHGTTGPFIRRELTTMFRRYSRDLMRSQPNHIELIGEKNTIASILNPVAREYTIPLTIGRGYCSLSPRHAMAERFEDSGKEKLVLLIVSDFDPEGEDIARSFARSMRDDFAIDNLDLIKVALTKQQTEDYNLPPNSEAKPTSSRYKKFVEKNGKGVFELESLSPETLQQITRQAIEGVIDGDAFQREIDAEKNDSVFLEGVRRRTQDALKGVDFDGENDE